MTKKQLMKTSEEIFAGLRSRGYWNYKDKQWLSESDLKDLLDELKEKSVKRLIGERHGVLIHDRVVKWKDIEQSFKKRGVK